MRVCRRLSGPFDSILLNVEITDSRRPTSNVSNEVDLCRFDSTVACYCVDMNGILKQDS